MHNLQNGIPQGSPLSVVLLVIAPTKIITIFQKYNKINYSLYADDLIILSKCNNLNHIAADFSNILVDINKWGEYSGTKTSTDKSKRNQLF